MKHTYSDRQIDNEDVAKFQRILNSHNKWFIKMFEICSEWGQEERINKNMTEGGEQTCPLTCLIKDHKGWSFTEDTPHPPSRPVIAGNVGINRCLSETLSLIIEPIIQNMKSHAIDSTGNMLSLIDDINNAGVIKEMCTVDPRNEDPEHHDEDTNEMSECEKHNKIGVEASISNRVEFLRSAMIDDSPVPDIKKRLTGVGLIDRITPLGVPIKLPVNDYRAKEDIPPVQEAGFVMVGSDVEKLFPSLKPLEAARLTRMAVLETDISINNFDPYIGMRYIFIMGGREFVERSGLSKYCPTWLGERVDLISISGKKTNEDKSWRDTSRDIPDHDIKKIVGAVLEIGILVTMGTHLYTFDGSTYIQLTGGPIGLRLTAALANLVMAYFDQALERLLLREKLKPNLMFRFVDDGRIGLRPVRAGWRWVGGGMKYNTDWVDEDKNMGPQKRTTKVIHEALNSISDYLRFTTEDHLDFGEMKLPTLDCQLWVNDYKIIYEFYEKPQVANRTLQSDTALSRTSLDASLT